MMNINAIKNRDDLLSSTPYEAGVIHNRKWQDLVKHCLKLELRSFKKEYLEAAAKCPQTAFELGEICFGGWYSERLGVTVIYGEAARHFYKLAGPDHSDAAFNLCRMSKDIRKMKKLARTGNVRAIQHVYEYYYDKLERTRKGRSILAYTTYIPLQSVMQRVNLLGIVKFWLKRLERETCLFEKSKHYYLEECRKNLNARVDYFTDRQGV